MSYYACVVLNRRCLVDTSSWKGQEQIANMSRLPKVPAYILVITTTILILCLSSSVDSLSLVMMGAKRGKGGLQQRLLDGGGSGRNINQGRGQEITGVTLPAPGKLKGWEFGDGVRLVCANVDGKLYAVQGDCPRCGFDLWKGDIINNEAFSDLPRVACPTCSTTFGLRSGKSGPPLKRSGLQGFVGGLAKTATVDKSTLNAKVFKITRDDDDGRVYCK